ncbi:odorant receptor 22c-like [Pectinophora gossypiella]|uniref:odorant receptor 22c-like n=1 Tax=Pectinophora gossypiella TaxID=13191 RepID=UPI00214ED7E0|nr:odorant receptor 22c-like [Pectinophora gossypiella]
MLWNVSAMLRAVALNIDPRDKRPVSFLSYVWLVMMSASYYYVYLVSMVWFVFWRCRQTGELLAAIIVFSLGTSSEISMTKLLCAFIFRKQLRNIIAEYLACDALVEPGSRFATNLNTTLRAVKKRAIIVWNVIVWNGIIYVVKPLLMPGRHFPEDGFVLWGLEPMTSSPLYEVAFTVTAIGVYVTCYPAANVTSLFIIIAGYTEAQMLAWSEELKQLWDDALAHCRENSSIEDGRTQKETDKKLNEYITTRLIQVLEGHTKMINLLHQVEDVFRLPIAIEFMLLITGLIAELLGGLENTYIELPFALMLVGTDCFTGQRIRDASMAFEHAVYDSKWENFDPANRKIIMLMLQNSQKIMKLSAGGIATLSLECLMAVLRMTYSAYTTLRTTMHST